MVNLSRTRRRRVSRAVVGVAAVASMLALAACSDPGPDAAPDARSPAPETSSATDESAATPEAALSGDFMVFAAASLTESFQTLAEDFMAENPDVTVTFNFAGSSALAQQIVSGAPADVFAAASPATMQTVLDGGDADAPADEPVVFVRNTLQIAVPPDNPAGITDLTDFTNPDLIIALCAPEVPCGAAAGKVFAAAGLTPAPDTLEQDVKAALTKVELGEVDGALVYRTDVLAAGDGVKGIDFVQSSEAVNDYPIVTLARAPNAEAAKAFIAYVLSEKGQRVLAAAGFDSP